MAKKKLNFNEKLEELEEIVEKLDAGEAPLEELIKDYEKGMKLAGELRDFLSKAEQKIIEIGEKNEEASSSDEKSREE